MGRFAAPDFDGHNMHELEVQGARARGLGFARFRVREVDGALGSGCVMFRESEDQRHNVRDVDRENA